MTDAAVTAALRVVQERVESALLHLDAGDPAAAAEEIRHAKERLETAIDISKEEK